MKSQSRNGKAINIYLNNNICNEIDKLAENMGVSRSTINNNVREVGLLLLTTQLNTSPNSRTKALKKYANISVLGGKKHTAKMRPSPLRIVALQMV